MKPHCIAVTGSRHYANAHVVGSALDEHVPADAVLFVGDATGVDALALAWARDRGREYCVFRADWEMYGKAAGPLRNGAMLEHADELIAVEHGAGKGTRNCIAQAEAKGIPVRRIHG